MWAKYGWPRVNRTWNSWLIGLNPDQEKAAANFPRIRTFTVKKNAQRTPQDDCAGNWEICSPERVGNFSAVAYFFGRELHEALQTPVGLINSSWGGTDIAAWTSEEAQSKSPELKAQIDTWLHNDAAYDPAAASANFERQLAAWKEKVQTAKAAGKTPPLKPRSPIQPRENQNFPANLYNGMIAPLVPYALRGAIWYQGEHNTATEAKARLYFIQLPLLVEDWRSRWGAEFPLAWVQLPNFEQKNFRPLVREAMLQSLRVKNTGMAITTDIGDPTDNHPKNKQEVGRRLSLWALGTVYGRKVPATSGPLPAGHKVQGGEVVLSFQHADGGLAAKGSELKGFEIAGDDRQWKPAQARIEGDTVIVSLSEARQPVAVRYAWASNPDGNLVNGAGLPASPFRTDDWSDSSQPALGQHVYIGTYTGPKSRGIYRAELDLATGRLTEPVLAAQAENCSFLNIDPSRGRLYAVNEEGQQRGGVLAYAIDGPTGKLTRLGDPAVCGSGPCHLVVDRSGKCVLVASYGTGTVAALAIHGDGSLANATRVIQHEDAGSPKPRSPHAHSMNVDLANRIVVAADLGLDQLRLYRLDPEQAKLTPHDPPFVAVKSGSGPRHFVFHPGGKFAYSNMETTSEVIAFAYDESRGTLLELQTLSTLPTDFQGNNSTAEIQVHPSGRFVYVSNRGHDSIAIFGVGPQSGQLTALGHQSTAGKTPRNFGIDPTGQYLLAANQSSNNIVVFRIDGQSGRLTPTGQAIEVGLPVCVKFVPISAAESGR